MADTTSQSRELKIETMFVDGDTRTFSIKDPRVDISQSDIASLDAFMQTNNVLVGDKYGGTFGRITTATVVDKTTTTLDLENAS